MQSSSRVLYILAAREVSVMLRYLLVILRSPFLWKGMMQPFVYLSIVFWLYTALQYRSSRSSKLFVFYISRGMSSRPAAFLVLIFVSSSSSSSCVNSPS